MEIIASIARAFTQHNKVTWGEIVLEQRDAPPRTVVYEFTLESKPEAVSAILSISKDNSPAIYPIFFAEDSWNDMPFRLWICYIAWHLAKANEAEGTQGDWKPAVSLHVLIPDDVAARLMLPNKIRPARRIPRKAVAA